MPSRLAGLSPAAQALLTAAREEQWDQKDNFTPQRIAQWLDQLEAAPQADAVEILRKQVNTHYSAWLTNPEKVRKKKPVQADLAVRLIKLIEICR